MNVTVTTTGLPYHLFVSSIMSDGQVDNDSLNISPVTLSSDWSRVVRLLILASLAVIGSMGNVFMISAIMVEDHLKKRGKFYLSL